MDARQPNEMDPKGQKAHTHGPAGWWKRLAAPVAAVLVLLGKVKGLALLLLHAPMLSFAATLGVSFWFYVVAFGWRFALVLTIVLVAHEFGHYVAFRGYGLPARLPNFIPFVGAFTLGAVPEDLEHDAYISLAGPLTGLGLAAACASISTLTSDTLWVAVAYFSAMINLLNMIPFVPFDGGRILRAIFPPAGDPRGLRHDSAARLRVTAAYLGTALGLVWIVVEFHGSIARHA